MRERERERERKLLKVTRLFCSVIISLGARVLAAEAASSGNYSAELQSNLVVVKSIKGEQILSLDPKKIRYQRGDQKAKERFGTFEISEGAPTLSCLFQKWASQTHENGEHHFVGLFQRKGCPDELHVVLKPISPQVLGLELYVQPDKVTGSERFYFEIANLPQEDFLGLGTQYTHLRLKGHRVPILAQEQGHGRGLQPISFLQSVFTPGLQGTPYSTYAPSSFFLSTKGRAFFFPHYEYGEMDFLKSAIGVKYWSSRIKAEVYTGDTPAQLVSAYTARIGRQKSPPDWIHKGAIIGIMGGSEKVRSLQRELERRNTPVSAWWLQDWVGTRTATLATRLNWNWQLDPESYPDWHRLVEEMHGRGERVLSYINPYISPDASVHRSQRNLYREALENGYLILHKDGSPYTVEMGGFRACLIDLFNSTARTWLKQVMLDQIRKHRISGWMADFGEAFPFDGRALTEFPQGQLHHRYIEEWARLNYEIAQENPAEELFIFQRSGFHWSQRYSTMYWLGDQSTTFDGLDGMKSALNGMLSSGLSGWQFNHSDIGGYFSVRIPPLVRMGRSAELFLRWAEMNTFTPLFRTHEGLNPEFNFQFYSEPWGFDSFSHLARVFADLFDYRKSVFEEAERTGLPAVRHLYLQYPEDPYALSVDDQFMLGADLLVAPVFDAGTMRRRVYLPAGAWTHLWSGQSYLMTAGGWIQQNTPLGQPPVYINPENELLKSLSEKYQAQKSLQK